ncbi:MAG: hypothetical protein M1839_001140 [Geoglossum umbratile]|nr:MAG: hypothetical protein M1839_001140 [Geoglossum umbratile]
MVVLEPRRRVSALLAALMGAVDRVADKETRSRVYAGVGAFARESPLLASFLLAQLLLSVLPLLLFASFAFSTLLLALSAAVAFSLFWIGVALLVLVPTLCVTLSLGVGVWLWAVGCWVIGWWVWGILFAGRAKREESVNGDAVGGGRTYEVVDEN